MASVNKVILVGNLRIDMAKHKTPREVAEHLLKRTLINQHGCMEYQGYVQSNGYAKATINRQTQYGHRAVYQGVKGEIPKGMDVCHTCDNRRCINPDHLFLGTRPDNMRDAVRKGRQAKGSSLPNTKINDFVVNEITRLAEQGIPYKQIAAQFGICRQHAGRVAINHGVRRNGVGE